jgi:hypothetical protein
LSVYSEWKHVWFGFWKEEIAPELMPFASTSRFALWPSVSEFVDPTYSYAENLDPLVKYLRAGKYLWFTSYGLCEVPGCVVNSGYTNSQTPKTDGTWVWNGNLDHYVLHHAVRLPDNFYDHILAADFTQPEVTRELILERRLSLDMPYLPAWIAKNWGVVPLQ